MCRVSRPWASVDLQAERLAVEPLGRFDVVDREAAEGLGVLEHGHLDVSLSSMMTREPPGSHRWTRPACCCGRAVGRLAEEPLDQHAVLPLAVEPPVAALDPDLLEAGRAMDGPARLVGGEDAARQLVQAAALGLGRELVEQAPAEALAARRGVDVHGVLADAGVEGPVGVRGHAREAHDAAVAVLRRRGRAARARTSATISSGSRGRVSNVAWRPAMPSL